MAKIDISKIENFDSMDADALRKFVEEYEFNDNSNELNDLKTQVQKLSKAKDDATSEAASFKKQLRERQTEAERMEAERQEELAKLRTENDAFRQTALISEYKAQALGMGYSETLATQRAEAMANNDFARMTEVDKAFIVEHDKEMTANAMRNTPKPPVGATSPDNAGTVTPEQFKKMGYGERVALQQSDPELYQSLVES